MPDGEAYPRALAAATKAVELDDNLAEAHTSLAFVTFFWNWDAAGAEREFKRALLLNPNDARTHHWYASFLLTSRRLQEALAQISMKIGEGIYKTTQEAAGAGGQGSTGGHTETPEAGGDDAKVVDADFEEVDDRKKGQ